MTCFLGSPACTGEGNDNPLQYSCLGNHRNRGAWWAAVYAVAQRWTRLKRLSSSSSSSSSYLRASLVALTVKNPPAVRETWVLSLGWEDPLEEGMATHSSILAWRIPMDRGACQATVHGITMLDTTEQWNTAQHS